MASAITAEEARKPRVLQEFLVVDLPSNHPARQQQQHDAPVPRGVEEEDESEKAAAAKEKEQQTSSSTPGASSFLDTTPPQSLRLPDAAIERASAGLRPGDKNGAQVLREVFGDALPWTEKELFRST